MPEPVIPVQPWDVLNLWAALQRVCMVCSRPLHWGRAARGDGDAVHVAECCDRRYLMVPHTVQLKVVNVEPHPQGVPNDPA